MKTDNIKKTYIDIVEKMCNYMDNGNVWKYTSQEEIELSDEIEEIESVAFAYCTSLKKIKNLSNVKKIGNRAFYECKSLEEIELSDEIEEIGEYAFSGCNSLKKIKNLSKAKKIGQYAFYRCNSLEEIELSDEIEEIEEYAFSYCTSLKRVEIIVNDLNNMFKFDLNVFMGSFSFADIATVIHYSNYRELMRRLFNTKHINNLNGNFIPNCITFYGPNLTSFEKFKVKKRIKKIMGKNLFNLINKWEFIIDKQQVIDDEDFYLVDLEISKQLNIIDSIVSKLPDEYKEQLSKKKNELISQYKADVNNEKPKLDLERRELSLLETSNSSIGNARLKLELGLNNIILLLSKQAKLVNLLVDLEKYNKLLTCQAEKIFENPKNIEELIKGLVFIGDKFGKNIKDDIIIKIKTYLDITKRTYESKFGSFFSDMAILSINDEFDPNINLYNNLFSLFNVYFDYYEKAKPYLLLKEALQAYEDMEDQYFIDDSIYSTIKNLRYIIFKKVCNLEVRDRLEKEYSCITNEYLDIIDKAIINKDLSELKYKNIVLELRKDIHPILEEVDRIIFKESNIKEIESKSSCDILLDSSIHVDSLKMNSSVIGLFILEISKLAEENNFDIEDKNLIKEKLKVFLNESLNIIKCLESKEDINKNILKLYSNLASIELSLQKYINDNQKFDKVYTKKRKK